MRPGSPLPLISFTTIMNEPLPPILWDVEPLIAQGDKVLVYGRSGSLKSWLLLHLGLHLAAGCPWFEKFGIGQPRRVLYIDEEMNERTLRRRVKRLGLGAGFKSCPLPFQAVSHIGLRFNEKGADALLHALETSQFDPDVVIIEALRRVLEGNENEAKDVSAFWHNVEPIVEAGKTLIISHHMRKGSHRSHADSFELASGSTDLLAGVDVGLAIKRGLQDAISIEPVKSREVREHEAFMVSLVDEGGDSPMGMRLESFMGDVHAEGSQERKAIGLVLKFLARQPEERATRKDILDDLKSHGVAGRTGERALNVLREQGRIANLARGHWRLAGDGHAHGS
jgi:energy-coupling factor transporter ATP-binding protein EcfA2